MARRVPTDFSKLPKKTHDILSTTGHLTTTGAYKKMKKAGAPVVTPLSEVRRIGRKRVGRRARLVVSTDLKTGRKHTHADATAVYGGGKKDEVRLHPLLKYRTPKHIRGIVDHELDHIRVMRGGKARY